MFRLDIPDLCESMLNLKDKDLLVSIPINIGSDQYFFVIEKSKGCTYFVKFCKGTTLNEVIKEIKEYPKAYHVGTDNAIDGTSAPDIFINEPPKKLPIPTPKVAIARPVTFWLARSVTVRKQ